MADWGRLLSGCRVYSSTAGSNPVLPARKTHCESMCLFSFDRTPSIGAAIRILRLRPRYLDPKGLKNLMSFDVQKR